MNNLLARINKHNANIVERQNVEDLLWAGEIKFYGGAGGDEIARLWMVKRP